MKGGRQQNGGFTLAELLVASTLVAIVMAAVYTSFSTSVRLWQLGSSDFQPYQDARTALTIMTRELQSVVGGTGYLFQGDQNGGEFDSVGQPMDVDEGMGPRVLWVKYELRRGGRTKGKTLVRQEALVEGTLPLESLDDNKDPEISRVKVGRKSTFVMADHVKDFKISYWWMPKPVQDNALSGTQLNMQLQPIELKKNKKGYGQPQGVKITLTMLDDNTEKGELSFTTFVPFQGPTTPYDAERVGGPNQ